MTNYLTRVAAAGARTAAPALLPPVAPPIMPGAGLPAFTVDGEVIAAGPEPVSESPGRPLAAAFDATPLPRPAPHSVSPPPIIQAPRALRPPRPQEFASGIGQPPAPASIPAPLQAPAATSDPHPQSDQTPAHLALPGPLPRASSTEHPALRSERRGPSFDPQAAPLILPPVPPAVPVSRLTIGRIDVQVHNRPPPVVPGPPPSAPRRTDPNDRYYLDRFGLQP